MDEPGISLGTAEGGTWPTPLSEIVFLSCWEEHEELEWLESLMLEADEEDSVFAVVWLAPFTWGRGGFIFDFFAGTIGSFCAGCAPDAIFNVF